MSKLVSQFNDQELVEVLMILAALDGSIEWIH